MVQEIVVTARKREERVQLVPVAVTAFTSEDTTRRNVRRLETLDGIVPTLLVTTALGTANAGRVSLRGIGQGDPSSSAEPAVGIYVDGVYQARFQAALPTLNDVERVEVLRGPQGTLFGKNAVGGAVNIVTARPSFEFGGSAEFRMGNYDMVESRLSMNVPLVPERAALRFSLATATRDGYVTNVVNGDKYADNKMLGGRAQLLVLPVEDVEVLIGVERAREDRKPQGSKCVRTPRTNTVSGAISQFSGFEQACDEDAKRSEFKFASDLTFAEDKLETMGANVRVSWDIAPDLTLASITAWRRQESNAQFDFDGTAVPLLQPLADRGRDVQDQWSQELQLTGRSMQGKLRYVLGLYAFAEEANERDAFNGAFAPLTVGGPAGLQALTTDNLAQGAPLVTFGQLPVNSRVSQVNNTSYAAYGQATYALTPELDLTLGLRRTQERKRLKRSNQYVECPSSTLVNGVLIPPIPCQALGLVGMSANTLGFAEQSARSGDWSPMATLAYSFTPDVLFYASYGNAFRSGGFNAGATRASEFRELDQEDLTSYEIGMKTTALDGRFRFNASGFYNIVENFRIPVVDLDPITGLPALSQTDADRVSLRGLEVEMALVPMEGLQLSAAIGAVRGKYEDFTTTNNPSLSDDERLPDVPNYTMSFAAAYQRSAGALGDLEVRLGWVHRGSNLSNFQGTDEIEVSKVGLLSGRLALALPNGRTEVAAFGSNLLNRRYFDNGIGLAESFGYVLRTYAPPRFYGLEVRHRF